MVGDNSTASRMSRNKAVLRNKLLKNAKSIQRNRCRIDNISAVIESVVRNYTPRASSDERKLSDRVLVDDGEERKETKEKDCTALVYPSCNVHCAPPDEARLGGRGGNKAATRGPRVLGKRRNVRTKEIHPAVKVGLADQGKRGGLKSSKSSRAGSSRNLAETKGGEPLVCVFAEARPSRTKFSPPNVGGMVESDETGELADTTLELDPVEKSIKGKLSSSSSSSSFCSLSRSRNSCYIYGQALSSASLSCRYSARGRQGIWKYSVTLLSFPSSTFIRERVNEDSLLR